MTNIKKQVETSRIDYQAPALRRQNLLPDPIEQFGVWFQQANEAKLSVEPNATTLATSTKNGVPSTRTVLLKEFDERGFVFYTNYHSQKGHELAENPNASLLFFWGELHKQIRIDGQISTVSRTESEQYFYSRPFRSKLGAVISQQSSVIPNRATLESEMVRLEARYSDNEHEIPLPEHWGGYRLLPQTIEFWQGQPDRLHDRFRYTRQSDTGWQIERLAP
ncbi:pyridoxamine 5'-phosphate oxidase [Anaerolineales bacterium HSG6]|nr:pyridoxamine 5'-phosphate oxidase [Anaerolineales bacterium HSG6]MDM8530833.1 pyridoxamine 5'-phosphate oxidase [Anaerolineales bacterium HSG25]